MYKKYYNFGLLNLKQNTMPQDEEEIEKPTTGGGSIPTKP